MITERKDTPEVTAILRCIISGGGVIEDRTYSTSGLALDAGGTLCYCIITLGCKPVPAGQFIIDGIVSK